MAAGAEVNPGTAVHGLMSRASSFKGVMVHVGWGGEKRAGDVRNECGTSRNKTQIRGNSEGEETLTLIKDGSERYGGEQLVDLPQDVGLAGHRRVSVPDLNHVLPVAHADADAHDLIVWGGGAGGDGQHTHTRARAQPWRGSPEAQ